MATVVEFTSVFVIVPFRAYMEPKVRCVCFCPGLDGSKMFKVFIFTLLPGTQQLPGMVPRNASERSRISSAFCGSQKSIYSGNSQW